MKIKCKLNVLYQTIGPSSTKETLDNTLILKEETGNARLVSADRTMYVDGAKLSSSNCATRLEPYERYKVSNGKQIFEFVLNPKEKESEAFIFELKEQIEGKGRRKLKDKELLMRRKLVQKKNCMTNQALDVVHSVVPRKMSVMEALAPPNMGIGTTTASTPFRNAKAVPSEMESPYRSPSGKMQARQALSPLPVRPVPSGSATKRAHERKNPMQERRLRANLTPPNIKRDTNVDFLNAAVEGDEECVTHKHRTRYLNKTSDAPLRKKLRAETDESSSERLESEQSQTQEFSVNNDLSTLSTPSKAFHGLLNMGNNCYMNAILQALASLSPLVKEMNHEYWLVQAAHRCFQATDSDVSDPSITHEEILEFTSRVWQKGYNAESEVSLSTQRPHFEVFRALQKVLASIAQGRGLPINPRLIKQVMGHRNFIFANHLQQDAHEFLVNVLDELEKDSEDMIKNLMARFMQERTALQLPPPVQPLIGTPHIPSLQPSEASNSLDKENMAPNVLANIENVANLEISKQILRAQMDDRRSISSTEVIPVQYFRGLMVQTLTCTSCHYNRRHTEHFYDLSLDLPPQPNRAKSWSNEGPTISSSQDRSMDCAPKQSEDEFPKCFCNEITRGERFGMNGNELLLTCAKSACSFQRKVSTRDERDGTESSMPLEDTLNTYATDLSGTNDSCATSKPDNNTPSTVSPYQSPDKGPEQMIWRLEDVISDLFRSQRLELRCEHCKKGEEAEMSNRIETFPRILILHLKRFELDPWNGNLVKRCDQVDAPLRLHFGTDGVVFDEDVDTKDTKMYRLQSIVHHLGHSLDRGHYITDICAIDASAAEYNSQPRSWRRMNDQFENEISEEEVLSASRSREASYIFFYIQQTT